MTRWALRSRRWRRVQLCLEELEFRWVPHALGTPLRLPEFSVVPPGESITLPPAAGAPPPPVLPNTSEIPEFESLPGAPASLYLDFNGHTEAMWGAFTDLDIPAFDTDGDPTTFSGQELAAIEDIWRRVAEDFLPFNLNVTTIEPLNFNDTTDLRAVIGGDGAWTGGVNSGIAYVGSFTSAIPNVVFVFSSNLGQGNAKLVADAVAHESGHAYGLEHQSQYDDDGNLIEEYHPGDLLRAPLMGDSYAAQRSLWWYGPTDESPDDMQDDMSLIAGAANGFGWRPDDAGDTPDSAVFLTVDGAGVRGAGIIGATDDKDYWRFSTDEGVVMFNVNVPVAINNLDVKIALLDSAGEWVVPWQDPEGVYHAFLFATVPAGTYYLVVASHGGYGDVGQYTIDGAIVPPGSVVNMPTDLVAYSLSAHQIELRWSDNADDAISYVVERTTLHTTWSTIATLDGHSNQFCDEGLDPATYYEYRVKAVSDLAASDYSNLAFAQTLPAIPQAPTDLIATRVETDRVELTWADNADNETGVQISRWREGADWMLVTSLPVDSTTYVDVGLSPDTVYTYRVQAVNGLSPSAYSEELEVATLPLTPASPTGLALTVVAYNQITLHWLDNADIETGYLVERTDDGVAWASLAILPPNATSYDDLGLSGSATYSYRVQAVNGIAASEFSLPASGLTPLAPPARPTDLVADPLNTSQIRVTWTDNADDEISFLIQRSFDGVVWTTLAALGANSTSFHDAGLRPETSAFYRVQAVNGELLSGYSVPASATTLPTMPRTPTALKVTGLTSSQVNLTWRDNAVNESGYVLERSFDGRAWGMVATLPAGTTTYQDLGLAPSKVHYYRVRAMNRAGISGFSNTATARTLVLPPLTPTDLVGKSLNKSALLLSWTQPSSNQTKFIVQRSMDGAAWATVGTTRATVKSLKVAKPPLGRTYTFRVIAINAGGQSVPSAVFTVLPDGAAAT